MVEGLVDVLENKLLTQHRGFICVPLHLHRMWPGILTDNRMEDGGPC